MLQGKIHVYRTRKRGRPRLEDVHDDLRKMKVKGWGGKMKNREEWRQRHMQKETIFPAIQPFFVPSQRATIKHSEIDFFLS
jgi:hypothetical protein